MKLSEQSLALIKPVFEKILAHPFIRELADGTLPKAKFDNYLTQDALYLSDFSKILLGISLRFTNPCHREIFRALAEESIVAELELHKSFSITIEGAKKSAACEEYTSYLASFEWESVEMAAAAVLPCFIIYKETGDFILRSAKESERRENPYTRWIETYSGEEYGGVVYQAVSVYDELGKKASEEIKRAMLEAFSTSSEMELAFWESAYKS